jgi:hypothetical protein
LYSPDLHSEERRPEHNQEAGAVSVDSCFPNAQHDL